MPDAYRAVGSSPSVYTSAVEAPIGDTMYFRDEAITLETSTDGLKHTILLAYVPDGKSQVWTEPDDDRDLAQRMREYGKQSGANCYVVMAWGNVRSLNVDKYSREISALLTISGGEKTTFTSSP